jgi:protein transport protein SEC31
VLATGTAAGVIDDSFSSSSSLDFYDLYGKKPVLSVGVDAKFHDLDWSKDNVLLAGALENGTVQFWNTSGLASANKVEAVAKGEKHTGSIKSLQFNPIQHNVLASGGSNGEIFIWDTKKLTNLAPFAPGSAMTPMDVVHSVSWNNSVSHIFASAGTAGYTSIWDLKVKKEVLQLSYTSQTGSRAVLSTVAWHPTQSTKLVTASEADGVPLILTWDLRNSNVPENILTGHKKGILSVDWNARDPSLLLSSGKDNTTILWNPLTSEKLAQYPTTSNWAFKTKFAPATPDYFATASLDNKIVIQSLQDTSPPVANRINSTSETDFWNKISDTDTQQPEFFVKQAPNWYGRKSSVSFAFGGKIVKLNKTGDKSSQIIIDKADLPGSKENEDLKTALESKKFDKIIENRIEKSYEGINKADWELLNSLKGEESSVFEKFIALNLNDDASSSSEKSDKDGENKGDDFFNNLNDKPAQFIPSGNFKLVENELTDALLTKDLSKAVDLSLKDGKLVEALVIALNGPEQLKQKVLNFYLNKNGVSDSTARLLYSVSSNDVSDLVENADVSDWREIGNAIKTYSSGDQEAYRSNFSKLGDRILKADPVKNRNDAILSYISGSSLEKVADIWVNELKSLEDEILKSKRTSSYDAHFDSLTEFVEKFSAYRSVLKLDAPIKDTDSPLLSTILEYTAIISTSGQFDLASKFLSLLPDDIPTVKLEKERISKATGISTIKTNTNRPTVASAASRYGKVAGSTGSVIPPAVASSSIPVAAPVNTNANRGRASVSNPYLPQQQATAVPSQAGQPFAQAPSAYPYTQPPVSAPNANPYRPTGPQAVNPYKPNVAASTPSVSTPLPPPPKNGKKHHTDGWNDLPTAFHKPQPLSRAPSAIFQPSTQGASQDPQSLPPPPISRNTSSQNAATLPPPPRSVSKTRKQQTPTLQEAKPSIAAASPPVNNRYTPIVPPSPQIAPGVINSNNNGHVAPPPLKPSPAPKNPYALPPQQSQPPALNAYAPPPSSIGQPPQSFAPLSNVGPSSTPKNPYAPSPSLQQVPQPGPAAPPLRAPLTAAASLEQQQQQQQQYQTQAQGAFGQGPPPSKFGAGPPPPPQQSNIAPPLQSKPVEATKPKHPSGDRSHIPSDQLPIVESLESTFQAIKPNVPVKYEKQVIDTEKRLNILFDHLNNEDLLTPESLSILSQLVNDLKDGNYESALSQHLELATNHSHEGGHWLVGIKRLIQFAEALN